MLERITTRRIISPENAISMEREAAISFAFRQLNQPANNPIPNEIRRQYHIGRKLGHGTYGHVFFAQNRSTFQKFALKFTTGDEEFIEATLHERQVLLKLNHKCIVKCFDQITFPNAVGIFLEYAAGGTLLKRIVKSKGEHLPEPMAKFFFYQMCVGLQYLHGQTITHRDIKADNILLVSADEFTLLKIADFGLCNEKRVMTTDYEYAQHTAPEVSIDGMPYTNKIDVWSSGILLYHCLAGTLPYLKSEEIRNGVTFEPDDIWKGVSAAAKDLITKTFAFDVDERPSIHDVLQHPWLSDRDTIVQMAQRTINE